MGLEQEKHFHRYHRVLSRASWSSRETSLVLLGSNLVINNPAPVQNRAGRMNSLIEHPSPDPYAAFAPRTVNFPAIVIPAMGHGVRG
jgi:hypothetical protein